MEFSRLAVLGVGNVRCGHSIVSTLASYFGERRLEISLYDSDAERLDLYERLARTMFAFNGCTHELFATQDSAEALVGAERVVVSIGDHTARKLLHRPDPLPAEKKVLTEGLLEPLDEGVPILSLLGAEFELDLPNAWNIAWPDEPSDAERVATPHQILRFIKGDEYPYDWLKAYERSPIKLWLDNPASLPLN